MESPKVNINNNCPKEEISQYLDGEFFAEDELLLEKHFAECSVCFDEMNLQKQLLTALDFAFEKQNEINLPKDFTKIVLVKAESGVSGLRKKEERFWALFLSSAIFLLLMLGFVWESEKFSIIFNGIKNQSLAIVNFIFHLTFDISIGLTVVLKTLSQKVVGSPGFIILTVGTLVIVFLLTLPSFFVRLSRAKAS